MSIVEAAPRRTAPAGPAARDTGIDLVRAVCVLAIVLLHGLQVGVTLDGTGPVLEYATVGAPWYAPVTWALQVLPIFFVIGGFAGSRAYLRLREKGGTTADFVNGRLHRLLLPAVLPIAAVGVALGLLSILGVPDELLRSTGIRYGEPFWFLGVFLAVQALLPALLVAHQRAPRRTMLQLLVAAVLVDVLRGLSGIDAIGYLNLAFVWLALQQLGFFLADGRIDALPARVRALAGMSAVVLLAGTVAAGIHSPDLIANLNPPSVALLLVGVAQTALLTLLRRQLTNLSRRPGIAALTGFVTARTMTVYLWHMPVLLLMAGVSALLAINGDLVLPEPSSLLWWLSRPRWLALALVLTAGLAWAIGAGERRSMPPMTTSARRSLQAVLLGIGAVLVLLVAGTSILTAVAALILILCALARIRAPQDPPTGPGARG